MSLRNDLKSVSDTAIEQLSARFHDLPRPLLAAIGAGDIAVERLAALRESLTGSLPTGGGTPTGEDVKAFAADLPSRAQQVAGEGAQNLEQFASSAPAKVQKLISELSEKASEFADSLSPDNVRSTVEAYTQMVAMSYDNLAERGGKAVAKTRPESAGSAQRTARPAAAKPSPTSETRTSGATRSTVRSAAGAKTPRTGAAKTPRGGSQNSGTGRASAGTSRGATGTRKAAGSGGTGKAGGSGGRASRGGTAGSDRSS
jgi:hypothetical protein